MGVHPSHHPSHHTQIFYQTTEEYFLNCTSCGQIYKWNIRTFNFETKSKGKRKQNHERENWTIAGKDCNCQDMYLMYKRSTELL